MEPQASSHSTESAALQLWTIRDAMAEDADRALGRDEPRPRAGLATRRVTHVVQVELDRVAATTHVGEPEAIEDGTYVSLLPRELEHVRAPVERHGHPPRVRPS